MSNKVIILILYFILGLSITNRAQDVNPNDFVGVWTSTEKTWVKQIIISYSDGNYSVQFKTEYGVLTCNEASRVYNFLSWSLYDKTEYGRWTIRQNATADNSGYDIVDKYGKKVGSMTKEKYSMRI